MREADKKKRAAWIKNREGKTRLCLDSAVVFVRNREGLMGASAVLARAKGKSALV